MIAEDLGVITPDVHALRDELGFPGMAVLIWAFGGLPDNPHRLENHRENQVIYTSTHDTDTLAGSRAASDAWPLSSARCRPCALLLSCRSRTCSGSAARRG